MSTFKKGIFICWLIILLTFFHHSNSASGQVARHPNNPMKWEYKPEFGDYYGIVKNSILCKKVPPKVYHLDSFPIKVYIENANNKQRGLIISAIKDYQYFFPIEIVESPYKATITVTITPNLTCESNKTSLKGCGAFTVAKYSNLKGYVKYFNKRGTVSLHPEIFDTGYCLSTIKHEIGHAMGIKGHSNKTDDLMFSKGRIQLVPGADYMIINGTKKPINKAHFFTSRDLNTLWLLYNEW